MLVVYFLSFFINNKAGTQLHLGIQSYNRHMTRSESLTYNIGEPRWPQKKHKHK